jgi:hypothetical protein
MQNGILKHQISLLFIVSCCLWLSCSSGPASPTTGEGVTTPPTEELFREADRDDILAAARSIIATDPVAALVTVDSEVVREFVA